MAVAGKQIRRWFEIEGAAGDRTLKQQLKGLDDLMARVPGKTVLDVGCAEGLISMHLFDHGAGWVHGLEVVAEHVTIANSLRGARACTFDVADANIYEPVRTYSIVIMLAVLHKLRDPSAACQRFAAAAHELVVIRLPPKHGPRILDARSGDKVHDIGHAMHKSGFMLRNAQLGPHAEWVGYYERVK